jgi:hypothetical protein
MTEAEAVAVTLAAFRACERVHGMGGICRTCMAGTIQVAVADEREACAKLAEAAGQLRLLDCSTSEMSDYAEGRCRRAAEFIRGRR